MKLLSKDNEELVSIDLSGSKTEPLKASVTMGDTVIKSPGVELNLTGNKDGLEANVRIPGMVNFGIMIEKDDIKVLKGFMGKDVLGFLMKALF